MSIAPSKSCCIVGFDEILELIFFQWFLEESVEADSLTFAADISAHFSGKCNDGQVFHLELVPNQLGRIHTIHYWHPQVH